MRKLTGLLLLLFVVLLSGCVTESDLIVPKDSQCTDIQRLEDGVCVDIENNPIDPECTENQLLNDGVCEDIVITPIDPICSEDQILETGVCVDKVVIDYIIDQSPSDANLDIDTKEETLVVINNILDKMQIIVQQPYEDDPLFVEEYPLLRSELDFSITTRRFDDPIHLGGLNLKYFLGVIQEDILVNETFVEDEWTSIFKYYDEKTAMYRIYVNENQLQYTYFYTDGYDRINGVEGTISNKNDVLEYTANLLTYYYIEDKWEHPQKSYFKENHSFFEHIFYMHNGEFSGVNFLEYDFVEDNYYSVKIDNSEEGVDRKKVRRYSADTNIYYSIFHKNNEEQFFDIVQYNDQNEELFSTNRRYINQLFFEFNLMIIDEWDYIDKIEYTEYLYHDDTQIELPYGVRVDVNDYYGIKIDGYKGLEDTEDRFNLPSTGLTLPINYETLLLLEETLRIESDDIYQDFYDTIYLNIEDNYQDIYNSFDYNVFYVFAEEVMQQEN